MATGNPLLDDPSLASPDISDATPAATKASGKTGNPLLDDPALAAPDVSGQQDAVKPAEAPTAGASTVKNWQEVPQGDISGGEALQAGAKNFIPSAERDIAQVGHAIAHPIETGSALYGLGKGLYSKMEGAAGVQQDPAQKAQDEASANAVGQSLSDTFGSWQGVKHSFANDPFAWASNVVPVASGAAKVAKSAGFLGDAADAAAAAKAAASAKVLADPAAAAAIKAVEPTLGVADLTPAAKNVFADAFAKKGYTPAAAKEAFAAHAAMDPATGEVPQIPTALTTGQLPAPGTERAVNLASLSADKQAVDTLGSLGNSSIGAAHPTEMAEAIQERLINSHNAISDAYKGLESVPGTAPVTAPGGIMQTVKNTLPSSLGLSDVKDLGALNSFPQTKAAYEQLQNLLNHYTAVQKASGETGLSAVQLNTIRKDLGSFYQGAKGSDYHGVGSLIDSFDSGLSKSLRSNTESFAAQGSKVADQLDATRQLFKDQKDTFFNSKDPTKAPLKTFAEGVMGAADKDPASGKIIAGADPDTLQSLQQKLSKSLMPSNQLPQGNTALHGHLMNVFGESKPGPVYNVPTDPGALAVNNHIRDQIFSGATNRRGVGSTLANDPARLHDLINSSIAKRAVDPKVLAHAKLVNVGRRVINAAPVKGGKLGAEIRHSVIGAGLQGAAGYVGHVIGHVPGAIAGLMIEPHVEHVMDALRSRAALSGAPLQRSALARAAIATAKAPVTVPKAALKYASRAVPQDVTHLARAAQERPAHAHGGKVGHQHLVDRMFREVEKAKRMEKGRTSVLLQQPDEAVAKALNVAQAAI
jgi:hypothetical protein